MDVCGGERLTGICNSDPQAPELVAVYRGGVAKWGGKLNRWEEGGVVRE